MLVEDKCILILVIARFYSGLQRCLPGFMEMPQQYDFALRKQPRQTRSRMTFDALVEACTRLLGEMGYQAVTTNHVAERAGVAIASLYEYFPHKDAIVAQVAERLVLRVMEQLTLAVPEVLTQAPDKAVHHWIQTIYAVLSQERELLQVFYYEVPYTNQLPVVRGIVPRLIEFSRQMRDQAGQKVAMQHQEASLYLIVNLVSNSIIQMILDPPADIDRDEILQVLSVRIQSWIAGH